MAKLSTIVSGSEFVSGTKVTAYEYLATPGQTIFSGVDQNSNTLVYIPGYVIVSLNGVILRPGEDFTATNGTSVTLQSAASENDELIVHVFEGFKVPDTVSLAEVNALLGTIASQDSDNVTITGGSFTGATTLATTNFTISESGGNLIIQHSGNTVASLSSSGVLITLGDITSNGTP